MNNFWGRPQSSRLNFAHIGSPSSELRYFPDLFIHNKCIAISQHPEKYQFCFFFDCVQIFCLGKHKN